MYTLKHKDRVIYHGSRLDRAMVAMRLYEAHGETVTFLINGQ